MIRVIISLLILTSIVACNDKRKPSIYEFPEGFRGWVFVFLEEDDAPALKTTEEGTVFSIPKNGVIRTSSSIPNGWATDSYYWISSTGTRKRFGTTGSPLIQRQENGSIQEGDRRKIIYMNFYVGKGKTNPTSFRKAFKKARELNKN